MMNLSIRWRLTLWNAAVTGTILISMGVIAYWAMSRALLNRIDAVLVFEYRETVERLENFLDDGDDELGIIPEAFLEEFLLRVIGSTGTIKIESPRLIGVSLPIQSTQPTVQELIFTTQRLDGLGEIRLVQGSATISNADWSVIIGTSLDDYRQELALIQNILAILLPLNLLIAMVAGYGLAGKVLEPISKITSTARKVNGSNMSERIKTDREDDELGCLAETLNAMLDRLAAAMNATRRFTADASHELMTPLSQIRTEAEVVLQAERSPEQYTEVLRSIIEEVDRLGRLGRQLLSLAKEDSRSAEQSWDNCSVDLILQTAIDVAAPAAEKATVTIRMAKVEPVTMSIDPDRLRVVIDNLIQNAIYYNRTGGRVEVSLKVSNQKVIIAFEDTGIGIPNEALPFIFDRFYRVDRARSRRTGGTGLGLSIASEIVEKMKGRIEVESRIGQGSTFYIVLPK